MNGEQLAGVIRHVIGFFGAYFVSSGYLTQADVTTAAGAIAALASVVWSFLAKRPK